LRRKAKIGDLIQSNNNFLFRFTFQGYKMGGWFSKNEENKVVENNRQVTNNVVIE